VATGPRRGARLRHARAVDGPVFDPAGKCIGRFNSIWRQEAPGVWKIVFDKGQACDEK
jgi:hypothetical protein